MEQANAINQMAMMNSLHEMGRPVPGQMHVPQTSPTYHLDNIMDPRPVISANVSRNAMMPIMSYPTSAMSYSHSNLQSTNPVVYDGGFLPSACMPCFGKNQSEGAHYPAINLNVPTYTQYTSTNPSSYDQCTKYVAVNGYDGSGAMNHHHGVDQQGRKYSDHHGDSWSPTVVNGNGDVVKMTMDEFSGPPRRNGVEVCKYYAKTGICSFGARCKFDHPPDIEPTNPIEAPLVAVGSPVSPSFRSAVLQPDDSPSSRTEDDLNVTLNSRGYPLRPDVEPCSFYQRTGECQYVRTCKYDHPEHIGLLEDRLPIAGFNSLGLPLRPNAQHCEYFFKTGQCRFGPTCKWDHPELTDPNKLQNFMDYPTRASEFNLQGYPRREGVDACQFYRKRGYCSYGVACKWDHPLD
eukprot:GEMP01022047.1.p1 GENE.GEMP01022047.1~~GEMP01022047.1.p1  ORF type:complete len:405 (+),score=30.57 GEMP01022047.1:397-1611(+)